jgi:hypothetical protein
MRQIRLVKKHLQGQHDQASHTPKGYGNAGIPGVQGGSLPGNIGDDASDLDRIEFAGKVYVGGWALHNKPSITSVYKGVPSEVAASIKKNGVKVGESWLGRQPSVYFTTDLETAKRYGELFATGGEYGGEMSYAIVKFQIPEHFDKYVIWDEYDVKSMGISNSFRVERNIPPNWIESVDIYAYVGDELIATAVKELPGKNYYTVVLIIPKKKEYKAKLKISKA